MHASVGFVLFHADASGDRAIPVLPLTGIAQIGGIARGWRSGAGGGFGGDVSDHEARYADISKVTVRHGA